MIVLTLGNSWPTLMLMSLVRTRLVHTRFSAGRLRSEPSLTGLGLRPPLLSSITARPFPPSPLVLARPPPRIFITPWRPHSFSRTVKPRRELRLVSPRLTSHQLASTRLDSTWLASTRLDSLRFVSSRPPRLVLPRLAFSLKSQELAFPRIVNSRSRLTRTRDPITESGLR